ncbi:hypothetical protein K443DRAFT_101812, partial [Laccaria amethystina LaAM-08-1]
INILCMPNCFLIVHVFTIMEVPLSQAQIGPCLRCEYEIDNEIHISYKNEKSLESARK